ncbi:MAG TPA: arylsulfatase [Patescibacteria group bacterium]|nr:arylsulfatase [Patescibacteria group bacterium]
MKRISLLTTFLMGTSALLAPVAAAESVLPKQMPPFKGKVELRAKDSKPDFPVMQTVSPDAPNILLILLDDVGFGATGTFGGPVATPNLDRLASDGLKYNQFHTTALSAPTRASLLTGRNHHSVHTGVITEMATGYPGYDSMMGKDTATVAEILRQNGYSTAWIGKNHNVPDWQTSQVGSFDLWPTGLGFEQFYGFIGGDTNQWAPALYDGTRPVEPYIGKPDYHLTTDLADKAIDFIHTQKSLAPQKPFFLYFAPGATHAPHHAPKAWIEKFRGQFDQGWDKQREITFARQKEMGIIPPDAQLTPRPPGIPDWDSCTPEQKKLYARMMEVYAAFLAHTDHEIGRITDEVRQMGLQDNTLIIFIAGDNGASGEGMPMGLMNEMAMFNALREDSNVLMKHIDELGGPLVYNHYPVGWAWAMDTPFQWTKQIASHYGGTRNGMVISWPERIKDVGTLRNQWHHVMDIAPTLMEAASVEQPSVVNGVVQKPVEGVSMVYTFDDAGAKSRHTVQYFEMFGNRALYQDGWIASTTPVSLPWTGVTQPVDIIDGYKWELYHVAEDFSQARNLAEIYPEKLQEMQKLFYEQARLYNVLPLDDRKSRFDVSIRPSLTAGRTSFTYYQGMKRIPEGTAPDMKNRSFSIVAEVEVPAKGGAGVLATQGGRFGGWGLFMRQGKLVYHYNCAGIQRDEVVSADKLTPGRHRILLDFAYDGAGFGKGGVATLSVDETTVAQGRIRQTLFSRISLDETLDIGLDTGTPITEDYQVPFPFNGVLEKFVIELKPIDPATAEALANPTKIFLKKVNLQD